MTTDILSMAGPAIRLNALGLTYHPSRREPVVALADITANIPAGCLAVIRGPSGSGKSTLMNIVAGLMEPSDGDLHVLGARPYGMSPTERRDWQTRTIGYVFQSPRLIPALDAVGNTALPLLPLRMPRRQRRDVAEAALELVGLGHRRHHYPAEMSGGERQRVGIARALVRGPRLLICDEPTGNLDREAAEGIVTLLEKIRDDLGVTILMVTHDEQVAARADHTLSLDKGRLRHVA